MSNLNKTFKNFYAPESQVLLDSKKIESKNIFVTEVKVEQVLNAANSFSITVTNTIDIQHVQKFSQELKPYSEIEIKIGYQGEFYSVLKGFITEVNWNYEEQNYLDVTILGYENLFLLTKSSNYKTLTDDEKTLTIEDTVQRIINTYKDKFSQNDIDTTKVKYPQIRSDEQNDFQILQKLAQEHGYIFFSTKNEDDKKEKLHFKFKELFSTNINENFTFTYGRELLTFSPQFDVSQQVKQVELIGWKPDLKREIVALYPKNRDKKESETDNIYRVRYPVETQEEADAKAKVFYESFLNNYLTGAGTLIGIPTLRPAHVIKLQNLGARLSSKYFVTKVVHIFSESGYNQSFESHIIEEG